MGTPALPAPQHCHNYNSFSHVLEQTLLSPRKGAHHPVPSFLFLLHPKQPKPLVIPLLPGPTQPQGTLMPSGSVIPHDTPRQALCPSPCQLVLPRD